MSTELINYESKETLTTLKQTVAQGATDVEFQMFVQFCKSTGLNPFKKEIWFIKAGGRVQMMTGINGFLAIANAHTQFDGMEIDVETDNQGSPLKAVAKVYRKDRKYPSVGIALMKEFKKDTPIWRQMPSVMLTKVAKSIAIREAFSQELNGLYTQEEMPPEYAEPKDITPKETAKTFEQPIEVLPETTPGKKKIYFYAPAKLTGEKLKRFKEYMHELNCDLDSNSGLWMSSVKLGGMDKFEVPSPYDTVEPETSDEEIGAGFKESTVTQ